jgi:hypothetical protein
MPTPYSVTEGKLLSSDPAAAAAAAAAAALLQQKQGPAAAGPGPVADTVSVAGPGVTRAGPGLTATTAGVVAAGDGSLHSGAAAVAAGASGSGGVSGVQMMYSGRGLERRSAAEADISAAFTTAWTCHMLELASDLQVSQYTWQLAYGGDVQVSFVTLWRSQV